MSSGGTQWGSSRYREYGYRTKRRRSAGRAAARTFVAPTPLSLADHAQRPADGGEGLEQAVYLLQCVVGVDAGADDALAGGHAGGQRGGGEDARLPEALPEHDGEVVGADEDRHDLGLRAQGVEAESGDALP